MKSTKITIGKKNQSLDETKNCFFEKLSQTKKKRLLKKITNERDVMTDITEYKGS